DGALDGAVTEGGTDGTMSGSSGQDEEPGPDPTSPSDPAPPLAETPSGGTPARDLGTTAGSWWPPEYDGIVSGWVELQRFRTSQEMR
ncbi:MAG: hypothetical protein AAF533_04895, partial [Acidobacteriota bacterium]